MRASCSSNSLTCSSQSRLAARNVGGKDHRGQVATGVTGIRDRILHAGHSVLAYAWSLSDVANHRHGDEDVLISIFE
jgi:hypothetical protein